MATSDDVEWEWCEEHEVKHDSRGCGYCQKERDDDDAGRVVEHNAIPPALLDRDRWMLYDTSADTERRPFGWDARRGRLDKSASWKNDDDLLSFDDAREAASSKETYGIGYVLDESGPFVAIDIDKGLDDAGRPKEWLPKLAPFLGETYLELSPSGTGIHVWYRGDLPEWWEDKHVTAEEHEGVDAFDGRFVTVTGEAPPAPWSDRTATINPLDDDSAEEWLKSAWGNLADESDESTPWKPEPEARTPGESRSKPVPTAAGDGPGGDWLGEAEAREALDYIDPNITYDKWQRIGYALVEHFGERRGGELFREWSKQGGKWDDDAPRLADDIINRGEDGVEIGTLVHHAKAGGWDASGAAREALDDAAAEGNDRAAHVVKTWGDIRDAYRGDDVKKRTARGYVVEKLLSEHDYVTPKDTGTIWVYHPAEGIYDRAGETHIRETLEKNLGALKDVNETRQIVEKVRDRTWIDREAFDRAESNPRLLCVENGVLNTVTRKLQPHSAEYMFKTRMPVKYDPEAGGEEIRAFANEVTAREGDAKTLMEVAGLSLWSDHSLYPAVVVLIGDGGNGKGVFGDALTALLGKENVSGVDLHDLSSNRFAVAPLENKYANLGEDIPGAKVNDLSTLKAITGGDRMYVERKHEDGYETEIRATPIFSVNEPPTFGERNRALKRRLVPIEFPYDFAEDPDDGEKQRDRNRVDKLTTDKALSGFLNEALDGLDRVRENGDVSLPEDKDERLERYEKKADPIAAFAGECLENRNEVYVTVGAAYEAYVRFCEERGKEPKTKGTFSRELGRTDELNVSSTTQVRLGEFGEKDRVRVFKHTYLTPKGRELCPESNWKETRAVNEKRGVAPWREESTPGLDTENPENRSPRIPELENDIQEAAALGDGVSLGELAAFVSEKMGYDKGDVEYRIKQMENERKLTKSTDGYEAPERADLTDLMD